jgi:hypothetical protein
MRRVRVVGDPHTSLDRFFAVLDAHNLLGVDGFLADDVQLVSMASRLGDDGAIVLRWLAEHAPTQTVILHPDDDRAAAIGRAGRLRRAVAALLGDGRAALITRTAISNRDVEELGVGVEPKALAAALDRRGTPPAARLSAHPRDLPRGLVQVVGCPAHAACKEDLAPWLSEAAAAADHAALRTLIVEGDKVVYDLGIAGVGGAIAVVHLVDTGLDAPDLDADHLPLLELSTLSN